MTAKLDATIPQPGHIAGRWLTGFGGRGVVRLWRDDDVKRRAWTWSGTTTCRT
ncbi:hypothetical protein [Rhodococcus wratislaviensis]|uniref:hypothetical protein n=1 Tax=Rhodococcus wratislaviensis TaxID=44752 RepID=UPI003664D9D0